MEDNFGKVKTCLLDLGVVIQHENQEEEYFIVSDKKRGINSIIVDCQSPIVVVEHHLFNIISKDYDTLLRLLQINNQLVHGAFVIDESGKQVLFKDTLQVENLDSNELEASIESLSSMLTEYKEEINSFAKVQIGS